MVKNRKPIPSAARPLPYPLSPDSPNPGSTGFPDARDSPSRNVEPTRPSDSQASIPSVSDISEGWVDADVRAHQDNSQSKVSVLSTADDDNDKVEANARTGIPDALRVVRQIKSREHLQQPASDASAVPPSLRVQPPQPARSTNPFHRTKSSESYAAATPVKGKQEETDIWAQMAAETSPAVDRTQPHSPRSPGPLPPVQTFSDMSLNPDVQELADTSASKGKDSVRPAYPSSSNPFVDPALNGGETTPWIPPASQTPENADPYGNLDVLDRPASRRSHTEEEAPKYSVPLEEANSKFASSYSHPAMPSAQTGSSTETRDTSRTEQPLQVQIPNDPAPDRVEAETPNTKALKQRSETYQIKHIRWLDSTSTEVRTAPIMVQNANGPCPLLALVNALTLSTPAHMNTPLFETLRVRENVTLGLLLDAVFDELMSGRRGNTAQELPDVGELYSFLINLHTGLNVNPQFAPRNVPDLMDGFAESAAQQEARKPGGFEDTKEMKLYATFSIPLIHGWLPPRTHPAFAALQRSANTYEDAQNLLFREEELEDKLQNQGLGPEDQQLLEDIASVKYFLSSSATQLTGYGIDTITDTLAPGSIAILFRNDHFSTLYKHPRSGQILTLVTDAGYAGHEEVVWESIVDVSGEGSEFFSGDFRPVGHHLASPSSPTAGPRSSSLSFSQDGNNAGWQTVPSRHDRHRTSSSNDIPPAQPPRPNNNATANTTNTATHQQQSASNIAVDDTTSRPTTDQEQEDADLALAMQLQEEEEEADRRAAAARRREEEEASQAYLAAHNNPTLNRAPNAGNNTNTNNNTNNNSGSRPPATGNTTGRRHRSSGRFSFGGSGAGIGAGMGGGGFGGLGVVGTPTNGIITNNNNNNNNNNSGGNGRQNHQPNLPPRPGEGMTDDGDAPPPTYEQASKARRYDGRGQGQEQGVSSSPVVGGPGSPGLAQRPSWGTANNAAAAAGSAGVHGRRTSASWAAAGGGAAGQLQQQQQQQQQGQQHGARKDRDKDCIVM